jgi:tetraacyldisaccharide 4'-kinase
VKAPDFWGQKGWQAAALAPLGAVTGMLTARRVAKPGFVAGIPVFCAGNAGVGGAGKTILARDLLARLPGAFALTRGYRGRLAGPVLVDPAIHDALAVGDEALLLAAAAPAIVARDRAAGARLALRLGASAIVMDDGLQNPALVKSCSFLVIDGGYGFGNGRLLPAGPLREPVVAAAARCRAAVMIGPDVTGAAAALPGGLPVLHARLAANCAIALAGRQVIGFAGIGRPEKFFQSLAELGADVIGRHGFPDHHVYGPGDAAMLLAEAALSGAHLVTTAKDQVKLPPALAARTAVVEVRLIWEDESALEALLHGEA